MYRLLLRLLPRHRRLTYGDEMREVFVMAVRASRAQGTRWKASLWTREVIGMVRFAWRERFGATNPLGVGPAGRDLRWAWRGLRRRGWQAVLIVGLFAVTLGANAVVFSAADSFVLRTVPFERAQELVIFQRPINLMGDSDYTQVPAILEWRKHRDLFSSVHGHDFSGPMFLTIGEITEGIGSHRITPGLLEMLGVVPATGRPFVENDGAPQAPEVVIISDDLARRLFGTPDDALGRVLPAGARTPRVIGVMPPSFRFPGASEQIWLPLHMDTWDQPAYTVGLRGLARLQTDMPHDDAAEVIRARWPAVLAALPERTQRPLTRGGSSELTLRPFGDFSRNEDATALFGVLAGAALCLLLIACANAANIELSTAAGRTRTYAVQTALGASRASLLRVALLEGAMLVGFSAGAGTALAWLGTRVLTSELTTPMRSALVNPIDVDLRVIGFMVVIATVTWLLSSLPSLLRISALSVISGLRHDPRVMPVSGGTAGARQGLMAAQVSLTVLLLVGALLYLRTYESRIGVDKGLNAESVVTLSIHAAVDGVNKADLERGIATRLRELPMVQAVARTWVLPPSTQAGTSGPLRIAGRDEVSGTVKTAQYDVDPGYISAMGISLIQGRMFDSAGGADQVVIDERFARAYWPNGDALGARYAIGGRNHEVIGVTRALRTDLTETPEGHPVFVVYKPIPPTSNPLTFVIKVTDERAIDEIEAVARSAGPRLRVLTDTIEARYARVYGDTRLAAAITSGFGALAWVVAAAGIYAVMAFLVAGRTREIGIRMALGADEGSVRRMVLQSSLRSVTVGIVLGLAASAVAYQSISARLFGVTPTDLRTYAGVTGLVVITALLATWLPASRAARVDPAVTLRSE
jgi:putative ABC transport system permease protein